MLRVVGDRVLVRPDVDDREVKTSEGGIILAQTMAAAVTGKDAVTCWSRGTVVALGTPRHPMQQDALYSAQRLRDLTATGNFWFSVQDSLMETANLLENLVAREPAVAIGDDVLFSHDAGQEVTIENETFLILKESELMAVVETKELS